MGRTKKNIEGEIPSEMTDVEKLQKQIDELTKLLKKQSNQKENPVFESEADESDISISGDKYIKVMSLCDHQLNLSTQSKGRGKIFTFNKIYEVKRILYRDLVDVMENHPNFLNNGLFIILNSDVVRKHDLTEAYEKILTKDKIETVLKGNQTDAVNIFKTANPSQQKTIAQLIIQDIIAGKEVDLNFVDRISRIVGYNLQERAESSKKLLELDEKI